MVRGDFACLSFPARWRFGHYCCDVGRVAFTNHPTNATRTGGLQLQNPKSEIAMILQLRQRHRRIFAVLTVLLPLLFVVGIALRRTVPQSETLPSELSPQRVTFTATGYERD